YLGVLGEGGKYTGEFGSVGRLSWLGDTLVVSDPATLRAVGFVNDGRPVFTIDLSSHHLVPQSVLSGRRLLAQPEVTAANQATTEREIVNTDAVGRDRTAAVRLSLVHARGHLHLDTPSGPLDSYFAQPWSDHDLFDYDPSGHGIVTVRRMVSSRRQAAPAVTVTRTLPTGRIAWTRHVTYVPELIAPRDVRAAVDRYVPDLMRVPEAARLGPASLGRTIQRALFKPAHAPAATRVVAGSDGTTWIRGADVGWSRDSRAHPSVKWTVLSANGASLAELNLPGNLEIFVADVNHVWGTLSDANGVPVVVRYRLRRNN
ncbi:MAG TPA: hypothetical protein VFH27_11865, partial [Longimicrobiaceae bacterium]|nr:hypothetical protein [Longimicrobiaceae bacterium]